MKTRSYCFIHAFLWVLALLVPGLAFSQPSTPANSSIVLHAARLLEIETGKIVTPGEVLVQGERIVEVGASVQHPAGAQVLDLGDVTLMPGLIDAHVHLFLHPGAEDLQTVEESVPQRTIIATLAARDDLMAGFTAERDMGTEGAGSADTAVRNAINAGLIPGPRLRISGNAVDILGGHEDANRFNPAQHVLSNATYANSAEQLVEVIREQVKEGADFTKIYETGPDTRCGDRLCTPYQYSEAELAAAVKETARTGRVVGVHATGEPGTLYAAQAGVASIDHAYQLGDETMRLMKEKGIFAVPTFTISEYFEEHAATPAMAQREHALQAVACERVQEAVRRGSADGGGFGRWSVSAWHAGAGIRIDGAVRHETSGSAAGWIAEWRETSGMVRPDWRAEGGLFCGHCGGARESVGGYQRADARGLRHESGHDLSPAVTGVRVLFPAWWVLCRPIYCLAPLHGQYSRRELPVGKRAESGAAKEKL